MYVVIIQIVYWYRYSTSARKPPLLWMAINRMWGRCWCGTPKEMFASGRRSHCSEQHFQIWRNYIRRNWHAVRSEVLVRDYYTCQICGKYDNTGTNLDVDHIIPKSLGGDEWDHNNLQVLCRICHAEKSLLDNKKFQSRSKSFGSHTITEWIDDQ